MYSTQLRKVYNPWNELWDLGDAFGRILQEGRAGRGYGGPKFDTWADEESAYLAAELPGVDPKDVEISVEGRELTVSGKRDGLQEEGSHYTRERWHGSFKRSVRLPFNVEADKVKAEFRNGLLKVTLPRAEAEKPRRIQITNN